MDSINETINNICKDNCEDFNKFLKCLFTIQKFKEKKIDPNRRYIRSIRYEPLLEVITNTLITSKLITEQQCFNCLKSYNNVISINKIYHSLLTANSCNCLIQNFFCFTCFCSNFYDDIYQQMKSDIDINDITLKHKLCSRIIKFNTLEILSKNNQLSENDITDLFNNDLNINVDETLENYVNNNQPRIEDYSELQIQYQNTTKDLKDSQCQILELKNNLKTIETIVSEHTTFFRMRSKSKEQRKIKNESIIRNGTRNRKKKKSTCSHCTEGGHYKSTCPNRCKSPNCIDCIDTSLLEYKIITKKD
jgi:hypothetical protein